MTLTRAIVTRGRERFIPAGSYTRLMHVSRGIVMSDVPGEMDDHMSFIRCARGRLLIGGLGIGMVLKKVLEKPEVIHATVLEIDQDVIDLVSPPILKEHASRVEIVQANALEVLPQRGQRYHAAWFDLWDTISVLHLGDMQTLYRRWWRYCNRGVGFWSLDLLQENDSNPDRPLIRGKRLIWDSCL